MHFSHQSGVQIVQAINQHCPPKGHSGMVESRGIFLRTIETWPDLNMTKKKKCHMKSTVRPELTSATLRVQRLASDRTRTSPEAVKRQSATREMVASGITGLISALISSQVFTEGKVNCFCYLVSCVTRGVGHNRFPDCHCACYNVEPDIFWEQPNFLRGLSCKCTQLCLSNC